MPLSINVIAGGLIVLIVIVFCSLLYLFNSANKRISVKFKKQAELFKTVQDEVINLRLDSEEYKNKLAEFQKKLDDFELTLMEFGPSQGPIELPELAPAEVVPKQVFNFESAIVYELEKVEGNHNGHEPEKVAEISGNTEEIPQTNKEKILSLLAQGEKTTQQIADYLGTTRNNVNSYLYRIKNQTGKIDRKGDKWLLNPGSANA